MMNQESMNYMYNYQQLKNSAEQLSRQEVPDVDKIIPLVKQGTEAYKFCMSRIEEVERLLQEIENETNTDGNNY